MRLIILSAVLAVVLAACQFSGEPTRVDAPADSASGTVSFDLAGPGGAALVVPVHINGEGPHEFVLDTGATLTCVNESLADSLNLPESSGKIGVGAGVGGSGRMRLVSVDSLRLGETKAFDLTACALNLSELQTAGIRVDGLLGLNFLKSFRMTLDFGANTLHLEPL